MNVLLVPMYQKLRKLGYPRIRKKPRPWPVVAQGGRIFDMPRGIEVWCCCTPFFFFYGGPTVLDICSWGKQFIVLWFYYDDLSALLGMKFFVLIFGNRDLSNKPKVKDEVVAKFKCKFWNRILKGGIIILLVLHLSTTLFLPHFSSSSSSPLPAPSIY